MKKYFTKYNKIFFIIFLILGFVLLISCVAYATEYTHIHVFYQMVNGIAVFSKDYGNDLAGLKNLNVYQGFEKAIDIYPNGFTNELARTVFNFQKNLASINNFIVVSGIIALVAIAMLFIFSNHNRRIYYKSNLVVGIACPTIIIIFTLILLVRNFMLMGNFNSNYQLYNWVAVLQNPSTSTYASQHPEVIPDQFLCTPTTFIIFGVFFVIIILYSIMMIALTIFKYNETKERRIQILERVVYTND